MQEEHLIILRKYFPAAAVPFIAEWLPRYGIHLTICKERRTKHGDFSYIPSEKIYRISVNGTLSPYAFLLTFVHEVAHLVTHKENGRMLMPHGKIWKNTFRSLMLSLPLTEIYPHDILVPLADYLKNPLASSDRHQGLALALSAYNTYGNKLTNTDISSLSSVESLSVGDEFIFREKHYTLGTKRRTLYLCTRKEDGRQYLFRPQTLVKKTPYDK